MKQPERRKANHLFLTRASLFLKPPTLRTCLDLAGIPCCSKERRCTVPKPRDMICWALVWLCLLLCSVVTTWSWSGSAPSWSTTPRCDWLPCRCTSSPWRPDRARRSHSNTSSKCVWINRQYVWPLTWCVISNSLELHLQWWMTAEDYQRNIPCCS